MIDSIKKAFFAGVGAAVVTKDQVEAALEDFVAQGKVTAADARAMAGKIADQGSREFEAASNEVGEKISSLVMQATTKTRTGLAALERRLRDLEARQKAARPTPKTRVRPRAKSATRSRAKR